jgi:hypothetical protein
VHASNLAGLHRNRAALHPVIIKNLYIPHTAKFIMLLVPPLSKEKQPPKHQRQTFAVRSMYKQLVSTIAANEQCPWICPLNVSKSPTRFER